MDIETYRRNVQFLKDKSEEYPYSCRTKVKFPRPEAVSQITSLNFVCAPLIKETEWRFRTERDMRHFKMDYTTLDNKS